MPEHSRQQNRAGATRARVHLRERRGERLLNGLRVAACAAPACSERLGLAAAGQVADAELAAAERRGIYSYIYE